MEQLALEPVASRIEKDDVTHVVFILDRSGSMAGHEKDVIGGVNTYVEGLRTTPGEVGISYLRFDNVVELVWNDISLPDVPEMTENDYRVRGSTALLDAIGKTVSSITSRPDHKYIVIIHTDGFENASMEWKKEKVQALIKEREAEGNWTFLFFGQDIDAWAAGAGTGVAAGNTVSYAGQHTNSTYANNSRLTNVMRAARVSSTQNWSAAATAASATPDITDEELAKILKGETTEDSKPGK